MSFEKDKNLSEKEISKRLKQMDKIDENIQKVKDKSNQKIAKLLSEDQYRTFVEKRNGIKLRRKGTPKRDQQGNRPQRDGMPDMPPPNIDGDFMDGNFN